jgi:hypothetical protein
MSWFVVESMSALDLAPMESLSATLVCGEPTEAYSSSMTPGQVEGFGVAYTMKSIPEGFKTLQRGRDAVHDELMPPEPMTILGQSRDGCR